MRLKQIRVDKIVQLFTSALKCVAPPPKLTISEWADRYRTLSSEGSAEAGQWNTSRAPYQREIMDAISDKKTIDTIIMSSAQVGKSEILNNTIGYYIAYDPCPIAYVMPTVDDAKRYSGDRLEPMIRDTKCLQEKMGNPMSRDKNGTTLHKRFAGGHLTLIGANAPSGLASTPRRVMLFDEIDRYPVSAGKEGDPVALGRKRTSNFYNRKHVMVSTPTIKGASKIEARYNNSTMEQWCLPCPECEEYQPLEWPRVKFDGTDKENIIVHGMVCSHCGVISSEKRWKSQQKKEKGKWIARKPEVKDRRGFHLNELASPWSSWERIVKDFLDSKDDREKLKTWVNTTLGESWEEPTYMSAEDLLAKRRQYYNCEVPEQVLALTCAVDVQDNRLEYEVCGWSKGFESWGIKYGRIMGDPGQNHVWDELDLILNKEYTTADNRKLNIMTTCVDSGGHFTTEVYNYCKAREFQRVWAIKGKSGRGISFVEVPKQRNKSGAWLFMLGVDVGKDTVMSRLQRMEEGEGYCHFPIETEKGYDIDYFRGLVSEKRVINQTKRGISISWEKITSSARNEPLDIRNYNTAAISMFNPDFNMLEEIRIGEPKKVIKVKRKIKAKKTEIY